MRLIRYGAVAAIAMLTAGASAPAIAGDDFYGWSCKALYAERNGIYADAGYCFQTAKAKKIFKNEDTCEYDNQADVRLSHNQHQVIKRIKAAERAKGCPR
jgi:YARHG domain